MIACISYVQSYVPNETHTDGSLRGRLVDTDCSKSESTINEEHSMYSCADSLPQSPVNDGTDQVRGFILLTEIDLMNDKQWFLPFTETTNLLQDTDRGGVEFCDDASASKKAITIAEESQTDEPETKDEENTAEEDEETEEEEVFSIEENIRLLPLPTALEREIKIQKGCKPLGKTFSFNSIFSR